jgi:putative tRNA adenosine deaminase-associated protein
VPYFASALARTGDKWSGRELDLGEVEDLDGLLDEMRRGADDADVVVLFVEEDDEWFAVVRLDEDGDPRVFLSDGRALESSELGALIGEAAAVAEPREEPRLVDDEDEDEDEDEEDAVQTGGDPVGDADLLSDLGTPARKLLDLSAAEGQLPADIISALCERAGCLEALDTLRLA